MFCTVTAVWWYIVTLLHTTKKFLSLVFPTSSSNRCCSLKMLQICMTIYTLHFNYDQQKIDDQISETSEDWWIQSEPRQWNPCRITLRNSFQVHFFGPLPDGIVRLIDTILLMLISKLYLVYGSANQMSCWLRIVTKFCCLVCSRLILRGANFAFFASLDRFAKISSC